MILNVLAKRAAGALAASLVASAAWAAPPEPAPSEAARRGLALPLSGTTVNPDWAERPDGDDFARYYPTLALMMELSGRATIECKVAATGRLNACEVRSEAPLGLGFGRAAIFMASSFRMKPMSLDGTPVDGATVSVPLRFMLPGSSIDEASALPASSAPSPQALALGRRISAIMANPQQWEEQARNAAAMAEEQENAIGGVVNTPERSAAYEALKAAFSDALPAFKEELAASYAADLTVADLAKVADFLESPAGGAFLGLEQKGAYATAQRRQKSISRAAAQRFCAKVKCEPERGAVAPRRPETARSSD